METAAPAHRLHGLDALRAFALLLGLALHGAMSYLPGAEYFWIVQDGERSRALAAGFFWIHSFRMTLFFLVAGYFGRLLLARRGAGGFVRDRFRRIVLPLLAFWWPVLMAIIAVLVWAAWLRNGGAMPAQEPPPTTWRNLPLTHLWFLYLLAIFYAAMLVLRGLLRAIGAAEPLAGLLARVAVAPAGALLLALPATAMLATRTGWWHWFGVPTPDTGLLPNSAALVAYGAAFTVGWTLQGRPETLAALARRWAGNLALAIASGALAIWLVGLSLPAAAAVPGAAPTWAYAFAYTVSGWAWTLALAGLALRFLDGHSPVRRYLADASYWTYLVHLPLAMAAQMLASRVDAPWWLEYPLVVAAVLAACLLSYHGLVRDTWLGGWLNGRRVARA